MAAEEDDDDRWSNFVDPLKSSGLGEMENDEVKPRLGDYVTKVLLRKTPGHQHQRKFTVALELVKLVTEAAYNLDSKWAAYIRIDNKKGVRIAPLRSLSEDSYECMVIIKRPLRLDGFRVIQRPIDELPQHRCLVKLNPCLSREEAILVHTEWEEDLDRGGYLRPDKILAWFNAGIETACHTVLEENHNVDKLTVTRGDDGTVTLLVTMTKYEESVLIMDVFTVNIFPSLVLTSLPKMFKLHAPIPCFGPYIQGQKDFRQLVLREIEEGNEVVFLDPKMEIGNGQVGGLSRDGRSWKINISLNQFHVYSIIDRYSRGINFRHVLILMSVIIQENKDSFGVLNNEMIVSTLFWVASKQIHKLRTKGAWLMRLLTALHHALKCGFLPSFYLPRLNLLTIYGVNHSDRLQACSRLEEMIADLKASPSNLFHYTGCTETDEVQNGDDGEAQYRENGEAQDGESRTSISEGHNGSRRESELPVASNSSRVLSSKKSEPQSTKLQSTHS